MDKARRLSYVAISSYFLHRVSFYSVVTRSPHVRHEWFKVGLVAAIGKHHLRFLRPATYDPVTFSVPLTPYISSIALFLNYF